MIEIRNLFPTPIGISRLPRDFTPIEKNIFMNLKMDNNVNNLVSVNTQVLDLPELADLKLIVENSLKEYFDTIYKPREGIEIYLTQSWVNYTQPGMSHHVHEHTNSIVSGVLYIQTYGNRDNIRFLRAKYKMIDITSRELNEFNSRSTQMSVSAKDLIFFPSDTVHQVGKVVDGTTRVSLAFNSFIKGKIGEAEQMTELYLGDNLGKSI